MDMNVIFVGKKRGVDTLLFGVTADDAALATSLINAPGVGKQFLVFATFPDGKPANVVFGDAPVVSSAPAVNQASINALLDNPPWEALIY